MRFRMVALTLTFALAALALGFVSSSDLRPPVSWSDPVSTVAWHDARRVYPKVCEVQTTRRYKHECRRYAHKGQLKWTPRDVALEITDGDTDTCMWRIGDTTYVYCLNGRRYTS